MLAMLCRNRVKDFQRWKDVFDSHEEAHRRAGLRLVHLWQAVEEPNEVFFLFEVDDLDLALAFTSAPEAAEAGRASGVLDGELHFLRSVNGA
ncbi:MAG: hypothetical protein GTO22_07675 [Gemmatimonadales bacterium]|nr:hypothetical protein [Gemmatimonadales bacterium]